MLGVSSLEEGVSLRQAGIKTPTLVLGTLYPFANFSVLFKEKLIPTVASISTAEALNRMAQRLRQRLPVHLKIDTGFGRIGVSAPNAVTFIQRVANCKALELQGVFTHFSSSDVDPRYTREQARAFERVLRGIEKKGIRPTYCHMANSSAILRFPETHGNLVRPGIAYYGIAPYAGAERTLRLEPALTWKTRVIYLKTVPKGFSVSYARTWKSSRSTRIATLAVGYADGYARSLSNRGEVLLRGRRAPVIGRVTMDMMMVDATRIPAAQIGDEVVLLGKQGNDRISAEELAKRAQTNAYEIVSRIATRVPRIYHG